MAEKRDYYEVLGVSRTSSSSEIKAAYRKLAIKFHPDKNPGDKAAEDSFKEASEAYEVLSDENKKARYDRFGHAGMGGAAGGGAQGFSNVEDIFSAFGDIFGGGGGSIFDGMFGGGQRSRGGRRTQGEPGGDLKIRLPLTLEEVSEGVTKKLNLKKWKSCNVCSGSGAEKGSQPTTCPTCQGQGQVRQMQRTMLGQMVNIATCPECRGAGTIITNKCDNCHGEGRTQGDDEVKVEIPAGVEEGNYLPMEGKGNAGRRGGQPGDLIVVMEIKDHEHFTRNGKNILYRATISVPDAILGTEIEVPTLLGNEKLTVEPGTQPGQTLRMSGKGLPSLDSSRRGDQIVFVDIYVPKRVTSVEKHNLKEMQKSGSFSPKPKKEEKQGFFDRMKEMF
ncbi:MAG: molecular chaperone DnaJ [Candidatus Kapaibacteriales bacterium]